MVAPLVSPQQQMGHVGHGQQSTARAAGRDHAARTALPTETQRPWEEMLRRTLNFCEIIK